MTEINWPLVAVTGDNSAIWMETIAAKVVRGRVKTVVVYLWALWALRAVSYWKVSDYATGMSPITMESHCEC